MREPHVANFISMVPNKRGPVELGLLEVGRQWVRDGGRFSVFYLAPPEPWYAELLDEAGIRYGVVGMESWHSDVVRTCAAIRPDLVHLHMNRHTMARELRAHGITVVRTEHSERPRRSLEVGRRLVRWWLQRPLAGFTCVSQFLAEQTKRDYLVGDERIRVIYNGCDLDRFRPRPAERESLAADLFGADPADRIVAVAAHLIPRKQQHLLIEAMPQVLSRVAKARLVIAGDGPDRDSLHRLADRLGVSKRVTFLHGDNDVAQIYAASHVGALTPFAEGLGASAIEAQACGLPLIATAVGGLAEAFVDGRTGLTVEQSPESIAGALVELLGDDARREEMGRMARQFCERVFSPQGQVESTCRFYNAILRTGRPA